MRNVRIGRKRTRDLARSPAHDSRQAESLRRSRSGRTRASHGVARNALPVGRLGLCYGNLARLLLYLPNNLGGYGLKKPKLNYRVDAPASLRELADRSYCLCDLCWPEANLAVEYDSRLHHSEPGRQSSDARRRSTLIALGFTVITVFPGHITDSGTFNRLARQVAKLTGKRLRYHDPEFTRKHLELREQLLENLWEGARA